MDGVTRERNIGKFGWLRSWTNGSLGDKTGSSAEGLSRDDSKYGYDSDGQNFYLKLYHEFQNMVLILFEYLYKIDIFPKFQRCGSKIEPATPIWSLNKRAWQAQFLSHTYETLEKYVFFIDL